MPDEAANPPMSPRVGRKPGVGGGTAGPGARPGPGMPGAGGTRRPVGAPGAGLAGNRPGRHDPFGAPPGAGRTAPLAGGALGVLPAPVRPLGPITIAHKGDPFFVSLKGTPPPVPPDIFVMNEAAPTRIFPDGSVTTGDVKPDEIKEQPLLRVSGIMTGDGVYAILEKSDGDAQVVKPGDEVSVPLPGGGAGGQTKRTYRVVSISGSAVKLQATENNVTFTQLVELSDQPVGGASNGSGNGP